MQVVFIGLAGSGKSTWGPRLAVRLNLPFADLDALVEAALGATIPEVFESGREAEFRACEARLLRVLIASEAHGVLATGGGATLAPGVDWSRAHVVWLDPGVDELEHRLAKEWAQRPLLAAAGTDGWPFVLRRQASDRRARYAELADERWTSDMKEGWSVEMERLALRLKEGVLAQDK